MARIRILAKQVDNKWINLLTTIVNFKEKSPVKDFKIIKEFNNSSIILIEGFINGASLQEWLNLIFKNKLSNIAGLNIYFNVTSTERTSFLSHKEYKLDKKLLSPFKNTYNSCKLYEYWCTDDSIKNIWNKLGEESKKEISQNLEISLYEMIDRVGNILLFNEINEIDVIVIKQNKTVITVSVSPENKLKKNRYYAIIQVKSFDDIILKQGVYLNERYTDFHLQDEDYDIEIEVYNTKTNECIFKNNFQFIKTIKLNMGMIGGKIILKNNSNDTIHSINSYSQSNSIIGDNSTSKEIEHQKIRNDWTNILIQKERLAFRSFVGQQADEAMLYLQKLIRMVAANSKYIYVADPYFFSGSYNLQRFKDYINIFASIQHIEVRIITCYNELPNFIKDIKKSNNCNIFRNITIKSIVEISNNDTKKRIKPAFHDRWIASQKMEFAFTNSINNFSNGVSFFKSYTHYNLLSEMLWNKGAESVDNNEEIIFKIITEKLYE